MIKLFCFMMSGFAGAMFVVGFDFTELPNIVQHINAPRAAAGLFIFVVLGAIVNRFVVCDDSAQFISTSGIGMIMRKKDDK